MTLKKRSRRRLTQAAMIAFLETDKRDPRVGNQRYQERKMKKGYLVL